MKTFDVEFEASAAIGFAVRLQAKSPEAAQAKAEAFQAVMETHFQRILDGLMCVDPSALTGYCDTAKTEYPIVRAVVVHASDDVFEVVNVETVP